MSGKETEMKDNVKDQYRARQTRFRNDEVLLL